MADRLRALSGRVGRFTPLDEHEARHAALADLRRDVENLYLASLSEEELNANDVQTDRHIQNSNPESNFDISCEKREEAAGAERHPVVGGPKRQPERRKTGDERSDNEAKPKVAPVSLGLFKQACPDFLAYAKDEPRTWRDVVGVSDLVRSMLGVSSDAGRRAEAAMGPVPAAIVLACILQRHERINSPGGYLRALTNRAEEGRFNVRPMVDALLSG